MPSPNRSSELWFLTLPSPRLRMAVGLFVIAIAGGTIGYMAIEDMSFLDALYQTITTISTVGFSEVQPLTTAGRIFTSVLIVFGVAAFFYAATVAVQEAIEGDIRSRLYLRRERMKIDELRNHAIICGFGRVGQEIAREFQERGVKFVIIDNTPSAVDRARSFGYLVVEGDASDEHALNQAGIANARTLLAASDSDSGNTFITLAAKSMNPSCYIVARVAYPHNEEKLRLAGADRVLSLYKIGGRRMVLSALQPLAADFMDTLAAGRHGDLILAEFEINEQNGLAGASCGEMIRGTTNATLLGVRLRDGSLIVGPPNQHILQDGDIVIMLAEEKDIATLQAAASAASLVPR